MDPYSKSINSNKNEENKNKQENISKNTNKKDNKNKNKNKNIIRIFSYNSRGFDITKQRICLQLMEMEEDAVTPILCNQENFVLKGNSHLIRKAMENFHVFVKPAKKDNFEGRPVNGMFTAVPKRLRSKAKDISPLNDRIQAILVGTNDGPLMIINVYFPPDPKTKSYVLDSELENVIGAVENVIESHQCRHLVMVGDMNTEYKRENGRVKRFGKFLSDNNFENAWKKFGVDYTHEFEKNEVTYTSTIDHIVWNSALRKKVDYAGVLHLLGNTSDHEPIYCDIQLGCQQEENEFVPVTPRPNAISTRMLEGDDWSTFNQRLDCKLNNLVIPKCINCRNVHCRNSKHIQEIDLYAKEILDAIDSSIETVASTKRQNKRKAKIVPGWTDMVKPFSENAKFWHAIWISAGRPLNTELHRIMKRTRNAYHYAIRKCKKAAENIIRTKLLENCVTGGNDVFNELRKLRHVQTEPPSVIDGNNKPAERFANVYEKLYNSTDDQEEIQTITDEVESYIDTNSLADVDKVTETLIADVIRELKPNKNDPVFTFNSNCIKHAPSSLHMHLANMIRCLLVHGHVSDIFLGAMIIPLIKDKLGDVEASDNYRSIALSSVILKIFDWIVMTLFEKTLRLDELQFSYQKNCSTTMCTWLVVESISHFTRNGSEVYSCFMDMKKAFDCVKHSLLFRKLIDRKVSPIFLRLLLYMYANQTARVKWNGTLSEAFSILNGVKQGAVLSAILFCVYIDDLIKELRRNRDGCWINGKYVGIAVYADDIGLISPSLDGLQNMVDTCSRYAKKHQLTFSTHDNPSKSKTKCMAFLRSKRKLRSIDLNGQALPWISTIKHLGSTITNNYKCRMDQDTSEKRGIYIAKNNELNQEFHYAHHCTKIWANNVYNSSFYGAPLWDMFNRDFEKIEKSWNVSHRIMLSLPRKTHRYFIEPLSGTKHVVKSIRKRFLNFVAGIRRSRKEVLRRMMRTIERDCRSTTGRNMRKLELLSSHGKLEVTCDAPYMEIPVGEEWKIAIAKEIVDLIDGNLTVPNLSPDELAEITESVCCS